MSADTPSQRPTRSLADEVYGAIGGAAIETGAVCLDCAFRFDAERSWGDLGREGRTLIRNFAVSHATGQHHRIATLGLSLLDPETAVVFLRDGQPKLLHLLEDDRLVTDGGHDRNPTGLPKQTDVIRPGDVVLDLAQGRPMQVIERSADTVEEWSAANDYDLLGNYGNSRLGSSVGDAVYTCVYVSNLKSEPSNHYDFPASRLGRVEVEAAHPDGDRVQDTLRQESLTALFETAIDHPDDRAAVLEEVALEAFGEDQQLVRDALEIAQAGVETDR